MGKNTIQCTERGSVAADVALKIRKKIAIGELCICPSRTMMSSIEGTR
jgi:hypothetical protein